jgi:hypothetical protein
MSRVCMNEFHVHAAVATAHSSRMPVLLMVPLKRHARAASTRLPPYWLLLKVAEGVLPRAGFAVLNSAIEIAPWCYAGLKVLRFMRDTLTAAFILMDSKKPARVSGAHSELLNPVPARRIRSHSAPLWPSGSRWRRRAECRRARPGPCSSWRRRRRRNRVGVRAANRAASRR